MKQTDSRPITKVVMKFENAFTTGMLIGAGFLATSAIFRLILVLFSYIINL